MHSSLTVRKSKEITRNNKTWNGELCRKHNSNQENSYPKFKNNINSMSLSHQRPTFCETIFSTIGFPPPMSLH